MGRNAEATAAYKVKQAIKEASKASFLKIGQELANSSAELRPKRIPRHSSMGNPVHSPQLLPWLQESSSNISEHKFPI